MQSAFETGKEGVAVLERCRDELAAKAALKELRLKQSREEDLLRSINVVMYTLCSKISGDNGLQFIEEFIRNEGAVALYDVFNASDPAHYSEILRVMGCLAKYKLGALALSTLSSIAALHSLLSSMQRSHEHLWLRSATHCLEILTLLGYHGHAERIHRIFLSNTPYTCLGEIMNKASTRHLVLASNVMAFMLMQYSTVSSTSDLVVIWKRAGLHHHLLSFSAIEDRCIQSLLSLLLLYLRVAHTPPPVHGGAAGSLARMLYLRADMNDVNEVLELSKPAAMHIAHETISGSSGAAVLEIEQIARNLIVQNEAETRKVLLVTRLSDEVRVLENELPRDLQIHPSRLENLTHIGRGSFGSVYKAMYTLTRESVAVKELHTVCNEPKITKLRRLRAFIKETLQLHRLRHNAVVNFYGWVKREHDTIWMVTEFCPGGTLTSFIRNDNLRPSERGKVALDVGLAIAPALAYIHSRTPRMVHLDVAARNVLLAQNGTYKLGDVGSLTTEGAGGPVICIPWAPPEALLSPYHASPAHDVWSFGMLLWEVMEGGTPFSFLMNSSRPFADVVKEELLQGKTPAPPYPVAAEDPLSEKIWNSVISPAWNLDPAKRPRMLDMMLQLTALSEETAAPLSPTHNHPCPEYETVLPAYQEPLGAEYYPYSVASSLSASRFELLCASE